MNTAALVGYGLLQGWPIAVVLRWGNGIITMAGLAECGSGAMTVLMGYDVDFFLVDLNGRGRCFR